jgi:anti-anti-sigma factor
MDKLVRFTEIEDVLLVEVLIEKLDLFETPNVLAKVERAISEKQRKTLVIDLNNVDNIDSSGIGFLIAVRNKLLKNGLPLAIINVSETVMQIFRLTKVIQLIQVYESLQDVPGVKKS